MHRSRITDWKIVWTDRVTGKQRVTMRRNEGMARTVCRNKIAAGHTDVRYRGVGLKRWESI
jgi:hypothetical protein